jgi:hypothetical protein
MHKANIYFNGVKYTYEFKTPTDNTDSALALSISEAMWEKHNKRKLTKFSGAPQHYNLIMALLARKRNIYTMGTGSIDYFADATRRSNEEKHVFDENTQTFRVLNWRVGKTFSNRLVIDIDDLSMDNLRYVVGCYEDILHTNFRVIKTGNGYWIIALNECRTHNEFLYHHCKVLNPSLPESGAAAFIDDLNRLDININGDWIKAPREVILALPGVGPKGNIDIMFTLLSIKRGQSTLRISKKTPTDKIELVDL